MRSLKAVLVLLGLTTLLAACSSTGAFAPTQDSQAYQDYVADLQMNPDVIHDSHGW